jgi:hypothetical protein
MAVPPGKCRRTEYWETKVAFGNLELDEAAPRRPHDSEQNQKGQSSMAENRMRARESEQIARFPL